jgi:hypothetical protein
MARYSSSSTEEPGQYPAPAFARFGLPAQTFGSGAPGGSPTSSEVDGGDTNEPGQYPSRETFTGVALDGTGAPGTTGIPNEVVSGEPPIGGAADSIQFSKPTFYKSMYEDGGMEPGYITQTAHDQVSGPADWTQANDYGYVSVPEYQMPGVAGNTPTPGSGQYQTGDGQVLYGGYLKGNRPGTGSHPSFSGPGT